MVMWTSAPPQIEPSRSRPRVSNDNPYSESHFKTLKYQPEYPGRFRDAAHARTYLRRFVSWYNHGHHHIGLNGFTPAEVYHGHYLAIAAEDQLVLDAAYANNTQRWINGAPRIPMPPALVAINPAPPLEAESCSSIANNVVRTLMHSETS